MGEPSYGLNRNVAPEFLTCRRATSSQSQQQHNSKESGEMVEEEELEFKDKLPDYDDEID